MNRRDFFGRGAAIAATAVIPRTAAAEEKTGCSNVTPEPQSLRDIETVRAGEVLCHDVDSISLDGVKEEWVAAFNVREGWADIYTSKRPLQITRRYGKVTYTLKLP